MSSSVDRMVLACIVTLAACGQVGDGGSGSGSDPSGDPCTPPANAPAPSCTTPTDMQGDLQIMSCTDLQQQLTQVAGTCWRLEGTLTISGESVTSVALLGALQHVGGLSLVDTGLVKFDTAATVTVGGGLLLEKNQTLSDISQLTFDPELDGVTIDSNPALSSIGALTAVNTITAGSAALGVQITNNLVLESLELDAQSLQGPLQVQNNEAVADLSLPNLLTAPSITVTDNPALGDLSAPSLMAVGEGGYAVGVLDIERMPLLTSLELNALNMVSGAVTISNTGLTTLGMFGTGLIVGSSLTITSNKKLTDVGQVAHATSVGSSIKIDDNAVLTCAAAAAVGCCVHAAGFDASNDATATCSQSTNAWCLQGNFPFNPNNFQCYH